MKKKKNKSPLLPLPSGSPPPSLLSRQKLSWENTQHSFKPALKAQWCFGKTQNSVENTLTNVLVGNFCGCGRIQSLERSVYHEPWNNTVPDISITHLQPCFYPTVLCCYLPARKIRFLEKQAPPELVPGTPLKLVPLTCSLSEQMGVLSLKKWSGWLWSRQVWEKTE